MPHFILTQASGQRLSQTIKIMMFSIQEIYGIWKFQRHKIKDDIHFHISLFTLMGEKKSLKILCKHQNESISRGAAFRSFQVINFNLNVRIFFRLLFVKGTSSWENSPPHKFIRFQTIDDKRNVKNKRFHKYQHWVDCDKIYKILSHMAVHNDATK